MCSLESDLSAVQSEIRQKAFEALERALAAELDARLEVKKWEEFLREYPRSHD